jgi:hypothetical protein
MTVVTAFCLLTLAGTTARADHEPDPATPLEATFATGVLLNFGRASQHYQHYRSHAHFALPSHGPRQDAVSMAFGNNYESADSSRGKPCVSCCGFCRLTRL